MLWLVHNGAHYFIKLSYHHPFLCCRGSARQPRPFVSAKVPKTIDAQSGLMRCDGRKRRRASQLAELVLRFAEGLKQGSPDHESVHQEGRTAGVGSWKTSMTERQMKESRTMYSV